MKLNHKKLEKLKDDYDLTYEEMAEKADSKLHEIKNMMAYGIMPKADVLAKVAFVFGVWAEDLLVYEEDDYLQSANDVWDD